jgi:hypothetical protein
MEWEDLDNHASKLLSSLMERKIIACIRRSDYYFWSLNIADTPISEEELELLFSIADADDLDRESYGYEDFPIMELCQGLSRKLITKTLPFVASTSFADDEGIWFVGSEISENADEQTDVLVSYPETDSTPDLIHFITSSDIEKNEVLETFTKALQTHVNATDRLSRLDVAIEAVRKKFNCITQCISIPFEVEIK